MSAVTKVRMSVPGILSIMIACVLIMGQIVMPGYLASIDAPHSVIDAFLSTMGLFKLSLTVRDNQQHIPATVQFLRVLAPLAAASSVVVALQKQVNRKLDFFDSRRWREHDVIIGNPRLARLRSRFNPGSPRSGGKDRIVFVTSHDEWDSYEYLRQAGIRVCRIALHSQQLMSIVRHARSVTVDLGDDDESMEWAMHIIELFREAPFDSPQSILVHVGNSELVRLESLIPERRLRIVATGNQLASGTLQIVRPVRGLNGPLNVVVVSDHPNVSELLDAMWQHVRLGEDARVTVVGPSNMREFIKRSDFPGHMVQHVVEDDLGDADGVASRLSAYCQTYDHERFGHLASPVYVWTKHPGVDALLVSFMLKTLETRIAIVGHTETSRSFSIPSISTDAYEGRVSVVTNEFLIKHGITGVVPDQEYLALALHSLHLSTRRGDTAVVGTLPWADFPPVDWDSCDRREHYFSLASACFEALHASGLSITAEQGAPRQLSNQALIRVTDNLAELRNIHLEDNLLSPKGMCSRYKLVELVSVLPSLIGAGHQLIEDNPGPIFDAEMVSRLASHIHQEYLDTETKRAEAGSQVSSVHAYTAWQNLRPRMRESNLDQARAIRLKLAAMRLSISRDDGGANTWDSSTEDPSVIEVLAEIEHQRWSTEMYRRGYTHGLVRDDEQKTHPDLCPYAQLDDVAKEKDRQTARLLSAHLKHVGLAAKRL